MTLLAIPSAISSAVSSLSHHGHKKGVHGTDNSTLDSTPSTGADSGSTQGLFGSLLDSAEQLVGIQSPTSTSHASGASVASTAANAGKLPLTAMINAARSVL